MSNADESLFLSQCQTVTAYVSSPYGVDTQTVLQFAPGRINWPWRLWTAARC